MTHGLSSLEDGIRIEPTTTFPIASLTKQFVATLVVMLAREETFRLEDSIGRWFPEAQGRWDTVTVRDLLCHLSGISDSAYNSLDEQVPTTEDKLVQTIASAPLLRAPGTKWEYCNSGYVLLGALIHRVTGQFYGDALFERIFFPLGMRDAQVYRVDAENMATGYELDGNSIDVEDWVDPSFCTPADGGLIMCIQDMGRWLAALDRGFPSLEVQEQLWTPARLRNGALAGYSGLRIGMGWFMPTVPGLPGLLQHEGAFRGFSSYVGRVGEKSVALLANIDDDVSELKVLGQAILRELV